MNLNCQPGDLAIIVRGANTGRLVTVLVTYVLREGWWVVEFVGSAGLTVNTTSGVTSQHRRRAACSDAYLRPLREQPGDDETLAWAGRPAPQGLAPLMKRLYNRPSGEAA